MKNTAHTDCAPTITINSQTDNPEHADHENCFYILHVDDDLCSLDVSKRILEIEGKFEVDTALTVEEAFQKMGQKKYDAVISDYEMPRQDGLSFLKALRDQQNNIPFVLFTGKGREDVAIKALNLGSDAYINKIGNPETVYDELSDALVKTIERKQSKKLQLNQSQTIAG
jgi:DNA-binding NtrC family response regulator